MRPNKWQVQFAMAPQNSSVQVDHGKYVTTKNKLYKPQIWKPIDKELGKAQLT